MTVAAVGEHRSPPEFFKISLRRRSSILVVIVILPFFARLQLFFFFFSINDVPVISDISTS